MRRRNFFCFAAALMLCTNFSFAQNSATEISERALEFESAGESIVYLNKMIGQIKSAAEKRALLAFLASLQEQISAYKDASDSYAQAAGIAAGAAAPATDKGSKPAGDAATAQAAAAGKEA